MSKITFRADDDLVRRLEEFDSSKSEVMREALRAYLDGAGRETDTQSSAVGDSIDDALAARVDALIDERLTERLRAGTAASGPQDVNVNVTVEGMVESRETDVSDDTEKTEPRKTSGAYAGDEMQTSETSCGQCGENVDADHVYCPNCGELITQPACGECGEELRSDWAFCPGCGRRTPAADVLDRT
jgi:Arc/MetJ-type ribon-helix-helix transcriptional regulator/RNA polymerase subunit RPABC4/transcription elongation factor Spt4